MCLRGPETAMGNANKRCSSLTQIKRRITLIARFTKGSYRWSPLALLMVVALAIPVLTCAKADTQPGNAQEQAPATAAQESTDAKPEQAEVEKALDSRISLQLENMSLKEALVIITKETGLKIDHRGESVELEPLPDGTHRKRMAPLINVKDVTVREALKAVLQPLGLDFAIWRDRIWVNNREMVRIVQSLPGALDDLLTSDSPKPVSLRSVFPGLPQEAVEALSNIGISISPLAISGGMAYVVWHTFGAGPFLPTGPKGFQIVDIHDPSAPSPKWSSKGGPLPIAMSVMGKTAYVGLATGNSPSEGGALEIFDVQDVSAPKSLGVLTLPEEVRPEHIAVANNVAYIGYRYGLYIVDVGDPTAPRLLTVYGQLPQNENGRLSSFTEGAFISGIAVDGPLVYLAANGIRILDVSDLSSPKEVGSYRIFEHTLWISVQGGIAYAGVFYNKRWPASIDEVDSAELVVVDVTDSRKPRLLRKTKIPKDVDDFALGNGVVYASDSQRGEVYVCDLRDVQPSPVLAKPTVSSQTTLENNRLVTECKDGLKIFDVSKPMSPQLMGAYQIKQAP